MRIEDQRQQQRQAMQEQARGVYAALMRKRAESPDENLADETEQAALDEASVTLGYDDARRLADLDIVVKCVRIERRIADLEKEVRPQAESLRVAQAYAAETAAIMSQRATEQDRLQGVVNHLNGKRETLDNERGELNTLTHNNWQLLAVPDPEIESRKLHLFMAVGTNGRLDGARHEAMPIELAMISPRGHRIAHRDIVTPVGQSTKQRDDLVGIQQQLLAAHDAWISACPYAGELMQSESPRVNVPFGIYLMRAEKIAAIQSFANVCFTPELAAEIYAGESADPIILTPTGQSKGEAAELRAEYDRLVKKARAKQRRYDEPGDDGSDSIHQMPQSDRRRDGSGVLIG